VDHEPAVRRWLRRITAGTTTAGLLALAVPAATSPEPAPPVSGAAPAPTPATAALPPVELVGHRKPHPHRTIKKYRVRPGDTPSAIAVRYHAWTAQLIRMNHTSTLYVGQVIRVPVVFRVARACKKHKHHRTNVGTHRHKADHGKRGHERPKAKKPDRPKKPKAHKPKQHKPKKHHKARKPHLVRHAHGWHHRGADRAEVRRVIATKARRNGVNPDLALAIAWQEAGWKHGLVSSAGALGAMQVMPGTGQWMSVVVGRRLNLRDLHDNALAGVTLIRILRDQAGLKTSVAGYYQGLAGVRRHGMYRSTKQYVANVLYLKKRIAQGWNPA
jgi:LysM repeat protein